MLTYLMDNEGYASISDLAETEMFWGASALDLHPSVLVEEGNGGKLG